MSTPHPPTKERLLLALGAARDRCCEASAEIEINGALYARLHGVLCEIDAVAEILTGSREHFWTKRHG